jgi:hypothetical protein
MRKIIASEFMSLDGVIETANRLTGTRSRPPNRAPGETGSHMPLSMTYRAARW